LEGGRKLKWAQTLLLRFRMSIELLEKWCFRIKNILDSIKNGLFAAAKLSVDLLFQCGKQVWEKFISPAATAAIEHAGKAVKKVQNVVVSFLNWITGQVSSMVSYA
jgi:hypothetical protein